MGSNLHSRIVVVDSNDILFYYIQLVSILSPALIMDNDIEVCKSGAGASQLLMRL